MVESYSHSEVLASILSPLHTQNLLKIKVSIWRSLSSIMSGSVFRWRYRLWPLRFLCSGNKINGLRRILRPWNSRAFQFKNTYSIRLVSISVRQILICWLFKINGWTGSDFIDFCHQKIFGSLLNQLKFVVDQKLGVYTVRGPKIHVNEAWAN